MTNTVKYDSFFDKVITDNNGVSVCDINAGLDNLYKYFNDNYTSYEQIQRYFVSEQEDGYPDSVAYHSAYGSEDYWWWLLLFNRQDDAFEGIKKNWVYSINGSYQVNEFVQNSTTADEASKDERIGSIVELN